MADAFGRFTEPARRVLLVAQEQAQRLEHNSIRPEHILLGIALEKEGIAAGILGSLNVDPLQVQKRVEQLVEPGQWARRGKLSLSARAKRVIELAVDEARSYGHRHVGTEHLLLGLLREKDNIAYEVLQSMGINFYNVRAQVSQQNPPGMDSASGGRFPPSTPVSYRLSLKSKAPVMPSPIFGAIVLITTVAGSLTYLGKFPGVTLFVFVTGGWIISLCLHEFGHALLAWLGGDKSVADKGYLTLNPIKYTHGLFSIVFPLIFLAMGGIGLPGGAVYINPGAIGSRRMRSLTSAVGPIATAMCATILLVPFATGLVNVSVASHFTFWAGLALLAFLQITALFFNLLPIPGLDGFGVLEPYLSEGISRGVRSAGSFTYIIIFLLFFNDTPVGRGFWTVIGFISSGVSLDYHLVFAGLGLFQFWT
jgi:Zn-dependent protease